MIPFGLQDPTHLQSPTAESPTAVGLSTRAITLLLEAALLAGATLLIITEQPKFSRVLAGWRDGF